MCPELKDPRLLEQLEQEGQQQEQGGPQPHDDRPGAMATGAEEDGSHGKTPGEKATPDAQGERSPDKSPGQKARLDESIGSWVMEGDSFPENVGATEEETKEWTVRQRRGTVEGQEKSDGEDWMEQYWPNSLTWKEIQLLS